MVLHLGDGGGLRADARAELRGAFIDARIGHLYVRNAPYIRDAIGAQLSTMRREFIWSTLTTAELVEVSDALGRRLQASADRTVDADGVAALDAAVKAGEARRLGATRVAAMRGGRNAVTSGRRLAYVSDYEVEIAGERFPARASLRAFYDPKSERVKA